MMTRSQALKKKKELSLKRLEKFIEFLNLDQRNQKRSEF